MGGETGFSPPIQTISDDSINVSVAYRIHIDTYKAGRSSHLIKSKH